MLSKEKTEVIERGFLTRNHTTALKGIAIFMVLFSHVFLVYGKGNGIQWIAGAGVSLFLILSGYGINESFKRDNDLSFYWKKRLERVFIPYWIVYIALGLILGDSIGKVKEYALLTSSGPWYIGYIAVCYLLFWLHALYVNRTKDKNKGFRLLCLMFAVWFIIDVLFIARPDNPFLRARQMLCFPLGVVLSEHKDRERNRLKKLWPLLLLSGIGMFILSKTAAAALPVFLQSVISLFTVMPMAYGIIGISEVFRDIAVNKLTLFFGGISYELYLLQYFTFRLIVPGRIYTVPLALAVTIAAAYIYSMIYNRILEKLH